MSKPGYAKYASLSVIERIALRYTDMAVRLEKMAEEVEARREDLRQQIAKQDAQQIRRAKRQLRETEIGLQVWQTKAEVGA